MMIPLVIALPVLMLALLFFWNTRDRRKWRFCSYENYLAILTPWFAYQISFGTMDLSCKRNWRGWRLMTSPNWNGPEWEMIFRRVRERVEWIPQ